MDGYETQQVVINLEVFLGGGGGILWQRVATRSRGNFTTSEACSRLGSSLQIMIGRFVRDFQKQIHSVKAFRHPSKTDGRKYGGNGLYFWGLFLVFRPSRYKALETILRLLMQVMTTSSHKKKRLDRFRLSATTDLSAGLL